LKGYSDYDHKYKEFAEKFKKVEVPKSLTVIQAEQPEVPVMNVRAEAGERKPKFWDKFKNNLIELFKEEGDQVIR
jgi:cell division protein FtsA